MTPQATAGAGFGIGILSSLATGFGKYEQGQAERSAYDYNADVTLLNMRDKMIANEHQYATLVGKQAAGYAASGVDITRGSPLLIMAATQARGAVQGKMIEEQGTEEAKLLRYYGKVAAFQGTMAGIGSFFQGMTQSATAYQMATWSPKPGGASRGGNIPTFPGTSDEWGGG